MKFQKASGSTITGFFVVKMFAIYCYTFNAADFQLEEFNFSENFVIDQYLYIFTKESRNL